MQQRKRPRVGRALAAITACATLMTTLSAPTVTGVAAAGARSPHEGAAAVAQSPSFPATAVGKQARWFLAADAHLPIPTGAIESHFDAAVLAQVSPAELNSVLVQFGPLHLVSITTSAPSYLVFVAGETGPSEVTVTMSVGSKGLIDGLLLQPEAASSWAAIDAGIRSVAPDVHLLVARLTAAGQCQTVHAIDPAAPGPLGSAFKLYVLDALAHAVAAGGVSWGQELTVTDAVKSLPSGKLQNDPAGTKVTVLEAATDMISISDNTAADMLIDLVGRSSVEAATRAAGMADPALDDPFLTTRELFILKLDDWPHLASQYLALPSAAARLAFLEHTVDPVQPTPALIASASAWATPRDVRDIEWFASPEDICRVYSSLFTAAHQPGLANVAQVLEVNDGGLRLSPAQWKTTWFKGGSEPGVLTLNYLATTTTGHTFVVSVLTDDPSTPIVEDKAAVALLGAVKGAFQLAAAGK